MNIFFMTERDKSSTLAAVLGIVLGILGTVFYGYRQAGAHVRQL